MAVLEKTTEDPATSDSDVNMPSAQNSTRTDQDDDSSLPEVVLLDAMAELQSLDKPDHIKNCRKLADHFTTRILQKYRKGEEIHFVFDRFDDSYS